MRAGAPAFGIADSLTRDAAAAIRFTVSSICCGPWLQLAPTTATSHSSAVRTTSSGFSP